MSKLHIIYVPGLGDSKAKARGQRLITYTWRVYGVTAECLRMRWADGQPFAPKLERLLKRIDELHSQGRPLALVASSAGASAVLIAYAARPQAVRGVVCICGKINNAQTVSPRLYQSNPAFKESMAQLESSLGQLDATARRKILSIRPRADEQVSPPDTVIPGAVELSIPTSGHAKSIAYALAVAARRWLDFLKSM